MQTTPCEQIYALQKTDLHGFSIGIALGPQALHLHQHLRPSVIQLHHLFRVGVTVAVPDVLDMDREIAFQGLEVYTGPECGVLCSGSDTGWLASDIRCIADDFRRQLPAR